MEKKQKIKTSRKGKIRKKKKLKVKMEIDMILWKSNCVFNRMCRSLLI